MTATKARNRILSFALSLALLLGGMIWQSPMTLQVQAADNASEMQAGTWVGNRRYIEFGEYNGSPILWRVLEVTTSDGTDGNTIGSKTAFLLADDLLRDSNGDVETRRFGNGYNWSSSEIRDWLNGGSAGEFLHTDNFPPTERGDILSAFADDVFLLSETEVTDNRYFSDNEDRAADSEWWLRSSYLSNARMVGITGSVYNYQPTIARGVRPALKVNLSSPIFISQNPQYGVEITVTDGGGPVPGARVSLSGVSGPNAMFYTGADGAGRCRAPEGSYSVAVDKTGYAVKTGSVNIGAGNTGHTVTLAADDSLPGAVYFGQNSTVPLAWRVLDIDRDGGTALLLTESTVGSAVDWATVTGWINDTGSSGFLDSTNFSDSERASMLVNSDTGTKAFLLSKDEAAFYLPDWGSRSVGIFWWLRSSNGNEIVNGDGTFEVTGTCRPRPAVWLDLEQLYMTTAGGNTTLHALHSATITVTDGTNAIDGAVVTLGTSSMSATKTAAGNEILLTGTTVGGTVDFKLPQGTYGITAIIPGHTSGGTLTIDADGKLSGDLIITLEALGGVSDGSLVLMVGESGTFDVSLGEGSSASTEANISSSDTTIATVSPISLGQSGTVTVKGEAVGPAIISIGYSGGSRDGESDTVQVTVIDRDDNSGSGSNRSSFSGSSGSSSTPDSRVAKTQLPASAFSWDGERTLTIDHERITALGLLSVRWNDGALTRGQEFSAYEGSVIIRFSEDFIAAQAPGNHTVRVEFLIHTGETTVTVGGAAADDVWDNDTHNPNTGGYPDGSYPGATDNPNTGNGRNIWAALLLGSLGAAAMVLYRRPESEKK